MYFFKTCLLVVISVVAVSHADDDLLDEKSDFLDAGSPLFPEVDITIEEQPMDDNKSSSLNQSGSQDDKPPNFYDFLKETVGKTGVAKPILISPRNSLARQIMPKTNSADGHEDWRFPPKQPVPVDDSNLIHFLDGSEESPDSQEFVIPNLTSDSESSENNFDGPVMSSEIELQHQPLRQDMSALDTQFQCSDVNQLYFEAVSSPSGLYMTDRRRNRMDFLIYELSQNVPQFDMQKNVVVHWLYTSADLEECEMRDPATSHEFLVTDSMACNEDKNFKISSYVIPGQRIISTSLHLDEEDLMNFLPGKFSAKIYFNSCHQDLDSSAALTLHSWTSSATIPLGYSRPTVSWISFAGVEIAIALVVLSIGLFSGLVAVYLWKKMVQPTGADGFEYAKLTDKPKKASPAWV